MEAVFEQVKGVISVVSGYAGGSKATARYGDVSTEKTGHAEAVRITYDPARVSYGTLLRVYFSVAHDPTQLNRSEEHTSELQSLMRISYAVFCLKKKTNNSNIQHNNKLHNIHK